MTTRVPNDTQWADLAKRISPSKVFYGVCSTAADAQNKVVTCPSFKASDLQSGSLLLVKMTNAQTYNGNATINVNNTGAKSFASLDSTNNAGAWSGNDVVAFVYTGSSWVLQNAGGAIPIIKVTAGTTAATRLTTDASVNLKGLTGLFFISPSTSITLPAVESSYMTNGTDSIYIGRGNTARSYALGQYNYTLAYRAPGASIYIITDTNYTIPTFNAIMSNGNSAFAINSTTSVDATSLTKPGGELIFITPSNTPTKAHYSGMGFEINPNGGGIVSQYRLVVASPNGYIPVPKLKPNTPYKVTIYDGGYGGQMWAVLDGIPMQTPPSRYFLMANDTKLTATSNNITIDPNGIIGSSSIVRISIDFTWTKSTAGELSFYPKSSGGSNLTGSGTEVYTSGTTRAAVKRTSWPVAGKITNIKANDTVHIDIELRPGGTYDDDWGDFNSGWNVKTSWYKTNNFYEGTFFSEGYGSFGGLPTVLGLVFNTAPTFNNFSIKAETQPVNAAFNF